MRGDGGRGLGLRTLAEVNVADTLMRLVDHIGVHLVQRKPHETLVLVTATPDRDMPRPRFDDLPLSPNDPKGSAWGLYGKDDELGTLNLITEDVVKAAVKEVKHGIVVPLK